VELLMVRRSVAFCRNGRGGIVADHHWEALGDPPGWGDPHDWRGASDFDDPELKLI